MIPPEELDKPIPTQRPAVQRQQSKQREFPATGGEARLPLPIRPQEVETSEGLKAEGGEGCHPPNIHRGVEPATGPGAFQRDNSFVPNVLRC